MRSNAKRLSAVAAAVGLLAGGLVGGMALADQAADVAFTGGGIVAHRVATSDTIFATGATNTWHTVPGSTLSYAVPSGTVRLVTAEYTAESAGYGTGGCAARIVTRRSGSTTLSELYPRAGVDFVWDYSDEQDESHAMSRSIRVASGTRYFAVQVLASTADALTCYVDDWHFQINVHTAS